MKKIFTFILVLLLCGCNVKKTTDSNDDKYLNMIDTINDHQVFSDSSAFFDISGDVAKTNDGYRYYVIIDNPRNAMYGIEAIAIEKGFNYSLNMAANVGIFEDISYNMLPGQANVDKGYVSGLSISGITTNENPTIYVMVQWYSAKQEIHQEFFELNLTFEEE